MARRKSARLMDADAVSAALRRIAHEILENNTEQQNLSIVGIRTRGVPIAERLAVAIEEISKTRPEVGILDINLYRDDVGLIADHPVLRKTEYDPRRARCVDGSRAPRLGATGRARRSGSPRGTDQGRLRG
jgi:pyrimidine operon attenuation protein/uracil phosphoribosyltransferase